MSYQRVSLRISWVLLLLTIDDVINLKSMRQRDRRVYIENGDDQKAIHRSTTDEKLALDHDILKLSGFPSKPESTNGKARLIKRSASKFLFNVYKYNADKDNEKKPNECVELREFDLTKNDLRTIDESDVIITFTGQQSPQGAGGKLNRIWFDVDAVPAGNQMTSAELRLYRSPDAKNRTNRSAFTVGVYRVLRTKGREREMQLVDSANTTAGHGGWITLNVTESLLHWWKHPDENKGFYLSVHPIDRPTFETRPEDIGVIGLEGDAERNPFMVGFFRSNESDNARLTQPTLRSFKKYRKENKKRDTSDHELDSSCKVERLYVKFEDLQWENEIIAPKGYYANQCSGECKYPIYGQKDLTYHAIILARANMLHPKKIPAPCCAPTKLSAIDILFFANNNTILKATWNNMSVQECGCY